MPLEYLLKKVLAVNSSMKESVNESVDEHSSLS